MRQEAGDNSRNWAVNEVPDGFAARNNLLVGIPPGLPKRYRPDDERERPKPETNDPSNVLTFGVKPEGDSNSSGSTPRGLIDERCTSDRVLNLPREVGHMPRISEPHSA